MFGFNVEKIRKDFPVLSGKVIYLDSACMSLKPKQVVDKMNEYYSEYSACGGRSGHKLSLRVEQEVNKARAEVQKTLNASSHEEIIFTRNATEGVNIVANGLDLQKGDEVIVSDKEHNSNLIPWLRLKEKGVAVKVCASASDSTLNLHELKKLLTKRTKIVSIVHVSNLDGVTNPIEKISNIVHANRSLLMVDGAQSFPHMKIDVKKLGVDFFVLSGHKALGPTGVGVLYGKKDLLNSLKQFVVGGQTVSDSTYEGYDEEILPKKFEAGLQNFAGIIGFGEACRYLRNVGFENIEKHILTLNKLVSEHFAGNEKIKLIGPKDYSKRSGIFTFNVKGMNSHDVAKMLDASKGIALRSGAFCVHSWFNARKIDGAVRASFYFYNTEEEVRIFIRELEKICQIA